MINMHKYALVNNQNVVENIILWDGEAEWAPPEGMQLVNVENVDAGIGWKYENNVFVDPNQTQQSTDQTT